MMIIIKITYPHVAQTKNYVIVLASEVTSTIYIQRLLHPPILADFLGYTPNHVRRAEGRHLLTSDVFMVGLTNQRHHSIVVCFNIHNMKVIKTFCKLQLNG